jgi:hypothetical protein
MQRLFKGAGTQRHVGYEGSNPPLKGWTQRAWTGTPDRGSARWQAYPSRRTGEGSFILVTHPTYYDSMDYLWGSLKQTEARTPPVSILTLSYTTRGGPRRR